MEEEMKKYSAFISYKHGDLDTFVAENLHKAIETYHIPKNIRKMTGKKKIERVFRDKDELPISSNLADNIRMALENSEYLIVICSPRTSGSYWVQKEIETFIQLHGREHVLAVLIEGEPTEAFPEQLQFVEEEHKAEDGSIRIERVPIEPLAADLRAENRSGIKKKMKTEILRIMAPLLGCGYDDLRQRHRERRMRRMIGIFAGITAFFIVFGIYSAYNTIQINQQYLNKQRNQSRYLAETSQRLLGEGDREMAVQIALAALPEYEGAENRPYVPEAEYALNDALGVYSDGYSFEIEHRLNTDGNVEEMVVSDDNSLLAARDNMQNLYVWDTENYERILQLKTEYDEVYNRKDWTNIYFNSENQLMSVSPDTIECRDSLTGELLWEKEYPSLKKCTINRKRTEFFICTDSGCLILDALTGEPLSEMNDYMPERAVVFSPDQQYVAFDTALETGYGVVLWNLKTNTVELLTDEAWMEDNIDSMVFAGTQNIIVAASHFSEESMLELEGCIKMFHVETLEPVWTTEATSMKLEAYYYTEDTEFKNPIIVYTYGGDICSMNVNTGEISTFTIGDSAIYVKPVSDTGCFFVGSAGETGILSQNIDAYSSFGRLSCKSSICDCILKGDSILYRSWNDNAIMVSTRRIGESFQMLSSEKYSIDDCVCSADGKYMVHNEMGNLLILSLEDGSELKTIEDIRYFYLCQDTGELFYLDTENVLHRYNLAAQQEIESIKITEEGVVREIAFSEDASRLAVYSIGDGVLVYNMADLSQCTKLEVSYLSDLVISDDGAYVAGREQNRTLGIYDVAANKKIELEEEEFGVIQSAITVAHDHPWLAVNGMDQTVHIIDMETGKTLHRVDIICPDRGFLEFSQEDSILMLADIDSCISLYDLESGMISKKIVVEDNEIEDVVYLPERELCILKNSSEAYLLTTKDQAYSIIAQIPAFMGMDGTTDRIFVSNYNYGFGYFQYKSLDDLITQGKELINNEELTEQEKNSYYVD